MCQCQRCVTTKIYFCGRREAAKTKAIYFQARISWAGVGFSNSAEFCAAWKADDSYKWVQCVNSTWI